MQFKTLSFLGFALACQLTSCSPESISVDSVKKKKGNDDSAPGHGDKPIDFEKTCGIKMNDDSTEDKVTFSLKLKSFPIVQEGSQLGINYRVVLTANVFTEMKSISGGRTEQKVTVDSVEVKANSPLLKVLGMAVAKSRAKKAAEEQNNPKVAEAIPSGQWLNLVTAGGDFKDMLCAIAPPNVKETETGDKTGVKEYAPALPTNVNPLAPRETLEKEIGTGRTFNLVTKVTATKENWPPIGEYPTVVTIKPREPSFSMSDGKTYASDIAYTVERVVTGDPKAANLFSETRHYFINTKLKTLDAVVDATQRMNGKDKTPIIVLMRQE
jgi:hypothetical protein